MKALKLFGLLLVLTLCTCLTTSAQEVSVASGKGYGTTGLMPDHSDRLSLRWELPSRTFPMLLTGDSFVRATSGLYVVSYTDGDVSSDDIGISLNLPSTSTFLTSWGTAHELCAFEVTNTAGSCSATTSLEVR